jgi:hypothetical protein
MNVVMNRAPYGGSLQLRYTEPARALASTIELSADSWFDDDPADYPLSYSFSYGLASAGAGNAIDLGRRSFAKSALLIKPEAGNFILYCYVYDSFLASATSARELLVLEAAPLTAAATAALTGDVRRQLDEGNPDGGAQLIGAVASTFNAQANTTSSNMRRLSEAEGGLSTEAKAATRAALMQTVVQISGSAVNNPDPVKTKQTTMVIGSLMGAPEEQTGEAQDRGLNLLTGLLTATRARGQQMENGTAQAMLAATTGMIKGNNHNVQEARRRRRMRRLSEASTDSEASTGSPTFANGSTIPSGTWTQADEEDAALIEAARARSIRLAQTATRDVSATLLQGLTPGEAPIAIIADGLAQAVGRVESITNADFSDASGGGGFSVNGCVIGCGQGDDTNVDVVVTSFTVNPYGAAAEDESVTAVQSITFNQGGVEQKVNGSTPIVIKIKDLEVPLIDMPFVWSCSYEFHDGTTWVNKAPKPPPPLPPPPPRNPPPSHPPSPSQPPSPPPPTPKPC